MNIYAKRGDKVIFAHPTAGYEPDQETAAKYLVEGTIYTVEKTRVDSFQTDVYLQEFPGIAFNGCIFDDMGEER